MLYLIEYDRSRGRIVTLRTFDESDRQRAEEARLGLELRLNSAGAEREVVILEAQNKKALLHTHSRYFQDLTGLASRV